MLVSLVEQSGSLTLQLVEYYDHPDGSDRGGSACVTHVFSVAGGEVTHDVLADVDDLSCFGVELEELSSKEDALRFVRSELESARYAVANLERAVAVLEVSALYSDVTDYSSLVGDEDDGEK